MANKHLGKCPISLFIREIQIKAAMRYHFIPTRMAITKRQKKDNVGILKHFWCEYKIMQPPWKIFGTSSKS